MALTVPVSEIVEKNRNPLLGKHKSWGRVRLGDIATIQNGFAFKSSLFSNENGIPLIRIRDVGKDSAEARYTGEYDPAYIVNPGDLLVGMDGDFNCARWRGAPGLLNQRVCRITLTSDIYDPKLLDYALPGYLRAINEMTSSVTVKHLSSKTIAEIPLPLPPIDQQKHIVAEIEKQLSRLDESIDNLKRVQANLKRYKAAVLKAAVEGRLVETEAEIARKQSPSPRRGEGRGEGATYETGEQLLQRILQERRRRWEEAELAKMLAKGKTPKNDKWKQKYKEPAAPDTTELPELPEGWVWTTLPQLGELARGKSKHRPRDDDALYGGPYPFIQTGDVRRSEGSISEHTQTYSELGLSQSRLWPAGTLCITIAANIAETGILNFSACFPDSVVGFISALDQVTTHYVELFIRTAKEDLERFAPATAQKNINLKVLEAVAIPLPPLAEQHRIVTEVDRRLSILRETEAQVEANLQRAERLRQSILAAAFSGRLVSCDRDAAEDDLEEGVNVTMASAS